ncbi:MULTISPECIES: nucleotide exchange factor GrpE [Asaia]|uniref:Protein GrpE n=1 Tax=Asaia bogorensis TaxID=91915 RepID=A0A060QLF7_9PROT|nr:MULTISPECIES: nucleotide exchange factor GrpE [Asaia]ETC98976.1 heat shock protein GrpE [Asaia sp. SF2.1]CDG40701.1 Heat shock protein GrpE [Asaia bogorensis]
MTTENTLHDAQNDAPAPETAEAAEATTDTAGQTPESRIAALEAQVEEFRDKWMRSEAEMQNYRTRAKREVEDARQYAVQKFAKDVVEAAENLQRGLASLPPKAEGEEGLVAKLREGFESTERSFLGILERNGITCQHPVGEVFDANLHQAMAEQPSDEHAEGTVMQAWTPTWTLHGRLLKPAMVVVAKGGNKAAE